jgi:hypothetical protein
MISMDQNTPTPDKNPYISPHIPAGRENTPLGSGTITRMLGNGGMAIVYENGTNSLRFTGQSN